MWILGSLYSTTSVPCTSMTDLFYSRLNALGLKANTDKASLDRRSRQADPAAATQVEEPGHDYLRKYELFLAPFLDRSHVSLLELGAGPDWNIGASAAMWLDYFWRPDFHLTIADIKSTARSLQNERTSVVVGDLSRDDVLDSLAAHPFDIIIDDASHLTAHQIKAFTRLFRCLKPGGVYIIEDIHTSFGPLRQNYHQEADGSCTYSLMLALATAVTGTGMAHPLYAELLMHPARVGAAPSPSLPNWRDIDMVTFIHHACLVSKKPDPSKPVKMC